MSEPTTVQPSPVVVVQAQPAQPAPRVSGFAVTALVCGVVGLVLCWVPGVDVILGIIAATFGALGWHQASKGRPGFGMAIAGMVLGIVTLVVFTVLIIAAANS